MIYGTWVNKLKCDSHKIYADDYKVMAEHQSQWALYTIMFHQTMDLDYIWPKHCYYNQKYQNWNQIKVCRIKEMCQSHNRFTKGDDC